MYLGIDLGTSGVKAVLINEQQQVICSATGGLSVSRPHDGWSEQDPADWIKATIEAMGKVRETEPKAYAAIRGIGLSGQQHGATLLDAGDRVIRPCILWNDTRSHAEAKTLDTDEIRDLAGSIIFPGFTAPKLLWLETHEPESFRQCARVLLPKDYLRWWLTGEFVSDMSDASGTGWLDIRQRDWSSRLLDNAHMRHDQMPALVEGSAVSATLSSARADELGLAASTVVAGGAGDNAASACGMGTLVDGSAFVSLGTSGVVFASTDAHRPMPESAVHAFCHAVPDTWHQMGVILSATDTLNWLARLLDAPAAELTAALGSELKAPGGTSFVPYLSGERTPYPDAFLRGAITGIGHDCDRQTLVQSCLEGVTFALRDNLQALATAGTRIDKVTAIGGGSRSEYWLKMIATALGVAVETAVDGDFGAGFGAARLGLLAAENLPPATTCTAPAVARLYEPQADLQAAFDAAYERHRAHYAALVSVREAGT